MPELGPYGSMRGEVRENLPYRDGETGQTYPDHDKDSCGKHKNNDCVVL